MTEVNTCGIGLACKPAGHERSDILVQEWYMAHGTCMSRNVSAAVTSPRCESLT